MGVSYRELRRVCQAPVRPSNDVAGLLFGDFASLPITKLFVDLRLSPDYASVGFFLCGLFGAALASASGGWALTAAVLLLLYYILDCVDGEVARFQRVVDIKWGYYDYLFHMLIKPLAFGGVGLGVFLASGSAWALAAAFTASIATLWLKMFMSTPELLFVRELRSQARRSAPYRGSFADSLEVPASDSASFALRFDMVTLRALLTNFDIGLLLLVLVSVLDVTLSAPTLPLLGEVSFRGLWLLYYGAVLPLDFLDYLVTYVRRGHFDSEMTRLVTPAHHFRAERDD